MVDPKQHADNRGMIESILRHIPGFSGYLEKEYRRESDRLQREFLAEQLQRSRAGLDEYASALANSALLDELPTVERLRVRLDTVITRLRGGVAGYSGFFDFVQVDEQDLDEVYDHDHALNSRVKALADKITGLAGNSEPPSLVVPQLKQEVEAINAAVDRRVDLLNGVAGSGPGGDAS